jgi:hypothetical protein
VSWAEPSSVSVLAVDAVPPQAVVTRPASSQWSGNLLDSPRPDALRKVTTFIRPVEFALRLAPGLVRNTEIRGPLGFLICGTRDCGPGGGGGRHRRKRANRLKSALDPWSCVPSDRNTGKAAPEKKFRHYYYYYYYY